MIYDYFTSCIKDVLKTLRAFKCKQKLEGAYGSAYLRYVK